MAIFSKLMWVDVQDIELTDTLSCDASIRFRCVSRGYSGDRIDPPEPPEFEVTGVCVEVVRIKTFGSNSPAWEKRRDDMLDWVIYLDDMLSRVAGSIIPDLYEMQCDVFDGKRYE